ncbi:MAG: hypothetical protein U0169_12275 [Polyangiaceae bacterium]
MDARAVYTETLKALARRHGSFGLPFGANRKATESNAACGDRIEVALRTTGPDDAPVVEATGFSASACLLCLASATLLAETLPSPGIDARKIVRETLAWLGTAEEPEPFGGLAPFRVVAEVPVRLGCVRLPWLAARSALGA